jgi:hypothetical protein
MGTKRASTTPFLKSGWLISAATLLALICAAIGFRFAFLAGCAGDLKVGLGDPLEALRLENIAMLWLAGATILGVLAIAVTIVRYLHLSFLVGLFIPAGLIWVVLWFAAMEVERFGVRSCGVWNGT